MRRNSFEFEATVSSIPSPARVQIVKNGAVLTEAASEDEHLRLRYSQESDPAGTEWYRLEVYDLEKRMLAVTNPIYVGRRKEPELWEFGKFLRIS